MSSIKVHIEHIKNIQDLRLELPLDKGLYAITGANGTGKSTIVTILSQLATKRSLNILDKQDTSAQSKVTFEFEGTVNEWTKRGTGFQWWQCNIGVPIQISGFSEGSIIYGSRFDDNSKEAIKNATKIQDNEVKPADDFVKESLGKILHNNPTYYSTLQIVKNKTIAERKGLHGVPYFIEIEPGKRISQYKMSSGENLLLSLLHVLNTNVIRRNDMQRRILLLIDEVELSLHPSAIKRLLVILKGLTATYNLIIYFASHSRELIHEIPPSNIFHLQISNGSLNVINPCYPAYATRDVYELDGYDALILVEDELAKQFIQFVLRQKGILRSKIVRVVPVGGWLQVVSMHMEMVQGALVHPTTKIISILDADIKEDFKKFRDNRPEASHLPVNFLPFKSVEKLLHEKLHINQDPALRNLIQDSFFQIEDFDTAMSVCEHPEDNKAYYGILIKKIEENGHTKEDFLNFFNLWIANNIDISHLVAFLQQKLT